VKRGQPTVVGADEHHPQPDRGLCDDLVADLCPPALLTGGRVEGDHVAVEAADRDQALTNTGTATQAQFAFVMPDALAGLQLERVHTAFDRSRVDPTVGDSRMLPRAQRALALARVHRPQLADGC